jgi:hypothetical protein
MRAVLLPSLTHTVRPTHKSVANVLKMCIVIDTQVSTTITEDLPSPYGKRLMPPLRKRRLSVSICRLESRLFLVECTFECQLGVYCGHVHLGTNW